MDNRTEDQKKGQDGQCETMRIKADNPQGFAVINAHDFDAKVHEEYVESRAAKSGKKGE